MHVSAPRGDQRSLWGGAWEPLSRSPPRNAVRFQSFRPPLEFLAVPLGNLAIFAVLVAVGLITGASATATSD